ncbi:MAG TPA: AAA family ATPase [Rubrobacteraceae bacterium]|nr:AAA family ATPase [Rubrobacteraceae bacterium]
MLLSVRLLGPPETSFDWRGLQFGRKKALALLCYLATEGGRYPRRELAELLWPKSDERRARADLRSILTRIRKTLEESGAHRSDGRGDGSSEGVRLLAIEGDLLGVEPRGIELDLRTLEAAVSLARSETSQTSPGESKDHDAVGRRDLIAHLEETLGVYRGEFMEGFSLEDAPEFEMWLEAERARWRGVFGELCERLSRLQAEAGRLGEATETTRLWTRHAPLEEEAHLRLVELLSDAGESEGALLAYENFRGTLSRELETEPSLRMRELAECLREEVEQRTSLGTSLARSAATTSPLSALEVPFAGRQEEFGTLVSEYHACLSGEESRVIAVIGEAGIGKTRLAKEFLCWAKARGADILEGAATEGAGLPYGPLVEAIRPRIEREKAPDDLLEDAWLSELSRLLPELKERYPDLPSPSSGDGGTAKGALFEAIARTVGALTSRAPVVLFLDDLQWADATTLEVLEYAGRRWAEQGIPILVLIAARPEESEASPILERWLPNLGRRLPVRSLALGPLGDEDVQEVLRRLGRAGSEPTRDPEESESSDEARSELECFGEWLAAETGGQPFYFIEMLKALLEEGKLVVRAHPDGGGVLEVSPALGEESALSALLPHSVREVILSRLSRLSPAAFELLVAGAALGRRFGFESLVGVASLGETEGLRGLYELVGRRLLLKEGGGQEEEEGSPLYLGATYSFSHEKIRQVVYTEGGQARRRVLHRRALEVLKESNAPAAQLARHALAAGLADQVFRYSLEAGDVAAEVFAIRDAVVHYEQAREVLAEGRNSSRPLNELSIPDLEHLYTQLGRTYELTDEWEKARLAYETILAFAREADEARLEVAFLNHLAAFIFHHETDHQRARALLEEARLVAEEADLTEVLVETECNLVDVVSLQPREFEHSRPLSEKALASARTLERPDLVARAVATLARLEMHAGRLEAAAAHAEEGAELSRQLADRPAAARTERPSMLVGIMGLSASWRVGNKSLEIQCLTYLALIRIFQGRLQEGIAIAREAQAISRDLPERMEGMSLWVLSTGLQEVGEYEEALVLARRGTELTRKVRDAFLLAIHLVRLGDAHVALLNLEEARGAYEEAVGQGHYEAVSSARLCVLAVLSEDWEDAHAHAKSAHEDGTFFNPLLSIHLHHEVEALLRGGDERLAREEACRLAERTQTDERNRVAYLHSLAVLSEWEGELERAIGQMREAEVLTEKIGLLGDLWQIRAKIGELHERRGETGEAREAFSGAAEILRDLAAKIGDEELRETFLAAPRVRRVLVHD